MCMRIWLHEWLCITHVPGVLGGHQRMSNPWNWTFRWPVDAGNRTQVLCTSRKDSRPESSLAHHHLIILLACPMSCFSCCFFFTENDITKKPVHSLWNNPSCIWKLSVEDRGGFSGDWAQRGWHGRSMPCKGRLCLGAHHIPRGWRVSQQKPSRRWCVCFANDESALINGQLSSGPWRLNRILIALLLPVPHSWVGLLPATVPNAYIFQPSPERLPVVGEMTTCTKVRFQMWESELLSGGSGKHCLVMISEDFQSRFKASISGKMQASLT